MTVTVNTAGRRSATPVDRDVGGHRARRVTAVLSAASRDEVRRIVLRAVAERAPLSVISTGRNWGLGSGLPIQDGTAVLDLSPMTAIRLLDTDRGIAVVEPGVTQRQLAAALAGTPWMLNVTSSCADTRLVGNAVDRGDGTIRSRSADVLGLEAVLADGTVLTTGGLTTGGVYCGRTVGPDLTQAIVQSNLGVVTAMVVALIARPESVRVCHAVVPRGAVPAVLDLLASLVATLPGLGMPRLRDLHLAGPAAQSPMDSVSVLIPVLGPETVVDPVVQLLAEHLCLVDRSVVIRCVDADSTPPQDPLYPRTLLARGTPTCQLVRHALRVDSCEVDRDSAGGLLIVLPLIPLDRVGPRHALGVLAELVRDYPGTVSVEINVASPHTARAVVQIGFDRTAPEHTRLAHAVRERLWQAFGGRIYRADIDHTAQALRGQDATNARVLDAVKATLDPHNILLPGRFLTPGGARP
jgi:4-cresol dehydrogenase (hydroxylating)